MSKGKRVEGRPYKRNKERLKRIGKQNALPCALCLQPIDYELHHSDAMSFTVDHIVPVSLGGNENAYSNMQPAHSRCNKARGNGTRQLSNTGASNASEAW